jgi:hypothetical protein
MLITWVSSPLETPERESSSFSPSGKCQKISRVIKELDFHASKR